MLGEKMEITHHISSINTKTKIYHREPRLVIGDFLYKLSLYLVQKPLGMVTF